MALVLNGPGARGFAIQSFGLDISRHALGRLLDRSLFRADPRAAIVEAHDAMLALAPDEGAKLFKLSRFLLPAGAGCFSVTPRSMETGPMAVARTWLHSDQLFADQARDASTWDQLLDLTTIGPPYKRSQTVTQGMTIQ